MSMNVYSEANTLVRVRENKLLTPDQWSSLLKTNSLSEAATLLTDWSYFLHPPTEEPSADALVRKKTEELFRWAYQITPNDTLVDLFTLRYDIHNCTILLREELGDSLAGGLWISYGKLSRDTLEGKIAYGGTSWNLFYGSIKETWERTSSWQQVQFLVERFYYAERKRLGALLKEPTIEDFISAEIDLHNLSIFVQQSKENPFPLDLAFVEGGRWSADIWTDMVKKDHPYAIESTSYNDIFKSTQLFDTAKDNFLLQKISIAKVTAFGYLPIFGYFYAAFTELTNLRLVLYSKTSSLSSEKTAERMRRPYEL